MGYFKIFAAIPGFFLSAFILMVLWGVMSPDFAVATISYVKAMLITLTIWLVVAPLAGVAGRGR